MRRAKPVLAVHAEWRDMPASLCAPSPLELRSAFFSRDRHVRAIVTFEPVCFGWAGCKVDDVTGARNLATMDKYELGTKLG